MSISIICTVIKVEGRALETFSVVTFTSSLKRSSLGSVNENILYSWGFLCVCVGGVVFFETNNGNQKWLQLFYLLLLPNPPCLSERRAVRYVFQNPMQRFHGICMSQRVRWGDTSPVPLVIKCILMLSEPILENLQSFCW